MLPGDWQVKLADMNVKRLANREIRKTDYVLFSAMVTQRQSAKEVIARCNKLETKVIAGGPLFTSEYEEFAGVDHFVLDEAEITLPLACVKSMQAGME